MTNMERPSWDQYFMTILYATASRSTDQLTHVGSVIVNQDNAIVSTGYNGPVRGIDPKTVPQTKPEKYPYFEHAERNAIYNAARHGIKLDGCKIYINWLPCTDCARAIVQTGINDVIVHKEGQECFQKAKGVGLKDYTEDNLISMKTLGDRLRWWSGPIWAPLGMWRGRTFDMTKL